MIHRVLWSVPAILLSLAVLTPAIWTLFDHHFVERISDHDHLVASTTHDHTYAINYGLHNHDEPGPIDSSPFFAEYNGLVAMASSLVGVCSCSERDGGSTFTYGRVSEGEIFPESVKVSPALAPPRSETTS